MTPDERAAMRDMAEKIASAGGLLKASKARRLARFALDSDDERARLAHELARLEGVSADDAWRDAEARAEAAEKERDRQASERNHYQEKWVRAQAATEAAEARAQRLERAHNKYQALAKTRLATIKAEKRCLADDDALRLELAKATARAEAADAMQQQTFRALEKAMENLKAAKRERDHYAKQAQDAEAERDRLTAELARGREALGALAYYGRNRDLHVYTVARAALDDEAALTPSDPPTVHEAHGTTTVQGVEIEWTATRTENAPCAYDCASGRVRFSCPVHGAYAAVVPATRAEERVIIGDVPFTREELGGMPWASVLPYGTPPPTFDGETPRPVITGHEDDCHDSDCPGCYKPRGQKDVS